MNIFEKKYSLISCKNKIKLCFHNKKCSVQLKTAWKSELSYKNGCFSPVGNYLPTSNISKQLIFNINAVVLIMKIC